MQCDAMEGDGELMRPVSDKYICLQAIGSYNNV